METLPLCTLCLIWIFTCLAFCAILLLFFLPKAEPEDMSWTAILTFLISTLLVVQVTWAIAAEGQGEHQNSVPHSHLKLLFKSLIVNEALWTAANALLWVSACWYLLGVHGFHFPALVVVSWFVLCIAHGIASILELLLICRPLSAQWDPKASGACGNQRVSFIAIEASALGLDLGIFIMPVFGLHIYTCGWRKMVRLLIIYEAGAVLLAISALRLGAVYLAVSPDFVYGRSYLGLLSASGVMLGVTLCLAPTYVEIYGRKWPRTIAEISQMLGEAETSSSNVSTYSYGEMVDNASHADLVSPKACFQGSIVKANE